jgi:preprotein translocase subunit YajC
MPQWTSDLNDICSPMLLAQTVDPGVPGEAGTAGTPTTGADGSANGTGSGTGTGTGMGPGGSGFNIMLPFVALLVLMLVFSIFSQRKEKKKRDQLIAAVSKHDRVQTIGGVIGSVVEVKSDRIVLKVDESSNTRITFARSAIQQVISSRGGGGSGSTVEEIETPQE